MFGRDFQGKDREALIERLRNRPYAYVAQGEVVNRLGDQPERASLVPLLLSQ